MIIYIYKSSKQLTTSNLQNIVQTIENAFSGLVLNTFTPNPFPSANQQINYHGGIAIMNDGQNSYIQIVFFENSDLTNIPQTSITNNNITVTFTPSVYSNIPSQTQIQNVLSGGGFL